MGGAIRSRAHSLLAYFLSLRDSRCISFLVLSFLSHSMPSSSTTASFKFPADGSRRPGRHRCAAEAPCRSDPQPDRDRQGLRCPRKDAPSKRSLTSATKAQAVPAGDVAGRAPGGRSARSGARPACWRWPKPIPTSRPTRISRELAGLARNDGKRIQMARRYYSGAARDLNVKVESFPSNLVAGAVPASPKREYFEIASKPIAPFPPSSSDLCLFANAAMSGPA